MRRPMVLSAGLVLLGACAAPAPVDEAARTAAEVEARMPGVDVDAIAACMRTHATADELERLAAGGTGAAEQSLAAQIIQRPETMACIRANDAAPSGA